MKGTEILAGGARLVRTQPRALAIWAALYLVAAVGMYLLLGPAFAELPVYQQQALIAQQAGLPPPAPPPGFIDAVLSANAIMAVLLVMIFAACVRAVAQGGDDPFGFLRFGADELRLIALTLMLFVGSIVISFAAGLVVGLVGGALGALFGGTDGAAGVIVGLMVVLALVVATIWLTVRVSLCGAYTVLRGRIAVREAWRATRGRFWPLFGVYFLIWAAFMVFAIALLAVQDPAMLAVMSGSQGDPAAMQATLARQQAMLADPFTARTVIMLLLSAVIGTIGLAFTSGAVATAAIGFDREDHP